MLFERVYLLAIATIVHSSYSRVTTDAFTSTGHGSTAGRAVVINPSKTDINNSSSTASDRIFERFDLTPDTADLDPTTRGVSNFLSCLVKRLYSSDGRWYECYYDALLTIWSSNGDTEDNETGEVKKAWNQQTLMLGAGFKFLLIIPFLAIIVGKAISLNMISLLISSIAFFHKSYHDMIY